MTNRGQWEGMQPGYMPHNGVKQSQHPSLPMMQNPMMNQFKDDEFFLGDLNADFEFEKHNLIDPPVNNEGFAIEEIDDQPNFFNFDEHSHDEHQNKRTKVEHGGAFTDDGRYMQTHLYMDPQAQWHQQQRALHPHHPHQQNVNMMNQQYQNANRPIGSPATAHQQQIQQHQQQLKNRANFDVLSSFFRVYFQPDINSTISKEIIYALYWKKILPVATRNQNIPTNGSPIMNSNNNMNNTNTALNRNAVYRKMLSVFKDTPSFTEDSKDTIKGLRLATSLDQVNPQFDKDVEILKTYLGTHDIFGFTQEDLEREQVPFDPSPGEMKLPQGEGQAGVPRSSLMARIERLESLATVLTTEITDLKNVIKKEMVEFLNRKRRQPPI